MSDTNNQVTENKPGNNKTAQVKNQVSPATQKDTARKSNSMKSSKRSTREDDYYAKKYGVGKSSSTKTDEKKDRRPGGFTAENRSGGSSLRRDRRGRGARGGERRGQQRGSRRKNQRNEDGEKYESQVIQVRRITRVVKGGKRMRFSAMVIVGDRAGKIGFALRKGNDFQEAVNKASKAAQQRMIKIDITEDGSIKFPTKFKFKSSKIFLKPAKSGTGLIAGGYIRPVLELAGIRNIYSKINGSRNKVVGVRCVVDALNNYKIK